MQSSPEDLTRRADACHARACEAHRALLSVIAEIDRLELWRSDGARDTAHWLWMRYGLSEWKARRWIGAAHALERLPLISGALSSGALGIDKAVELCRFATPGTEERLLAWAERVSSGAIRRRGDLEVRRSSSETREVEGSRYLRMWTLDEGRRVGIEGELPAAEGEAVRSTLEHWRRRVPVMPGEEHDADARTADALAALCGAGASTDGGSPEATVVVHAPLQAMVSGEGSACLESGGVVSAATARRLGCSGRVQVVWEDARGEPLRLGRASREPSAAMLRLLRHRDPGCVFPGCGSRAFTHAHHIRWWSLGGGTDLDNLALVCTFHHRLVHEHGWRLRREDGRILWSRPDGRPHHAGPDPRRPSPRPIDALARGQPSLPVAGV